jgi:uncharacterized phage infection (PIP) family protein YhgE|tara:strand:+ start:2157 stop:2714 length:558 start_codon:yes stop_codon:yes gene_type:complete
MSKITSSILIATFGIGCFFGGTFYAIKLVDSKVDEWDKAYSKIQEEVQTFVDVSNPKTIRLYTSELRKILDDVTFLGKIVESGQVSSEALDGYFSEYDEKLNTIKEELSELQGSDVKEQIFAIERILIQEVNDIESEIKSLNDKLKSQYDYTSELNISLQQSITKLKEDIDVIKNSKYGKKIWLK